MKQSQEIMSLLKDIQVLLEKGLKSYYAEDGLTVPQLTVVTLLGKHDRLMISDISKEMQISPAAVSGIIDRLEKQGLVERHRSNEDKRKVFVSLTKTFKSSHQHLEQNISGYLHLLLRKQDPKEVSGIIDSLMHLKNILYQGEQILADHIGQHTKE